MTYDLMNRRDNVTKHHSGLAGSLETVENYLAVGLDPKKMNLGFAYYSKWFNTAKNAGCDENPIGCPTVVMETEDGSDAGKSGAVTFEKGNMVAARMDLTESTDGTCGAGLGTKCVEGACCSQFGNWSVSLPIPTYYPPSRLNRSNISKI
jgi:chitinase